MTKPHQFGAFNLADTGSYDSGGVEKRTVESGVRLVKTDRR